MMRYQANVRIEMLPKNANVIITAPLELSGASVRIGEAEVGQLWPDGVVKRNSFFGIFARALPASKHAVSRLALHAGTYALRIEKYGYAPIEMKLTQPESGTTEVYIEAGRVKRVP